MQKKNLFIGALLLCTLSVLTGCKEIMGTLDNPVSSYLEMKQSEVTIYRGKTLQIDKTIYTTISDATPKYETSDVNIATVDPNGLITAVSPGEATITITLPATDVYTAAKGQLKVTVDGLIKFTPVEKEIAFGGTYNIGATTSSDGTLTYASSNESVATVDATGKVTAVACGDADITVSVPATASFIAETATFKAKVRITDADNFAAALTAGATNLIIADNAAISLGATDFSGSEITITGNADAPATITPTGSFTFNRAFAFKNIIIDGSSLNKPFIQMATLPTEGLNDKGAYEIGAVEFVNVKATGFPQQFFYCNKKNYLLESLTVENSIIGINCTSSAKTIFDFNGGGNTLALIVKNSTIWATAAAKQTNGLFYSSQSGKSVQDLKAAAIQTTTIENSTIYNIAYGKTVSTRRKNSQDWILYVVKNSIIANGGKSGQFLKGLNAGSAGKDSEWTVEGNVFNFDGAHVDEQQIGSSIDMTAINADLTVVTFADAANGDFTQSNTKAGDPRWIK